MALTLQRAAVPICELLRAGVGDGCGHDLSFSRRVLSLSLSQALFSLISIPDRPLPYYNNQSRDIQPPPQCKILRKPR